MKEAPCAGSTTHMRARWGARLLQGGGSPHHPSLGCRCCLQPSIGQATARRGACMAHSSSCRHAAQAHCNTAQLPLTVRHRHIYRALVARSACHHSHAKPGPAGARARKSTRVGSTAASCTFRELPVRTRNQQEAAAALPCGGPGLTALPHDPSA